ncbi:hypothetical protein DPMN_035008 [Dreissena polymorpha]|uniref:Uncharacterized protein n=1 Tax=Dreissena polymorpha TaxID=45954 RepID=A0A9D4M7V4_DREPO|nr:hypothetical protein DPMN_035008 [Dreissena polymorpha]
MSIFRNLNAKCDGQTDGQKNAPSECSHVFQPTNIIRTYLLTKFHEDGKKNAASRVINTRTIFELIQDFHEDRKINIIGTNLLTKFHEDLSINVASSVKNSPPPSGHVFQATVTIFKLIQDIIETNFLTKVDKNLIINVASRVSTKQILTPHNEQKAITKAHHDHIVLM